MFASECAGCHTLTGHDSNVPGGDLAVERLSVHDIESFVNVMPVHMTRASAAAVAVYVYVEETRLAPSR